MTCHITRVSLKIAGAIISKRLCGLVCDADDAKLMLGCFRQTLSPFSFHICSFLNVFGICLWGKEEAIATPGISIPVSPSSAVTDLLPLKSASLEVVHFTKLGADSAPKYWVPRPKLSLTLAVWPAILLAGVFSSSFAGEHSRDLTWRLFSIFTGTLSTSFDTSCRTNLLSAN